MVWPRGESLKSRAGPGFECNKGYKVTVWPGSTLWPDFVAAFRPETTSEKLSGWLTLTIDVILSVYAATHGCDHSTSLYLLPDDVSD